MQERGFFGALFDVSFTSFVTTRIIKVLYIITLVVIGLFALGFVVAAFANSVAGGLFALIIGAPLVALLYVIYTRVILEVLMAIFRIMELNAEQVARAPVRAARAAAARRPRRPPASRRRAAARPADRSAATTSASRPSVSSTTSTSWPAPTRPRARARGRPAPRGRPALELRVHLRVLEPRCAPRQLLALDRPVAILAFRAGS